MLAHPDRIKLHGYRPAEEPLDLYEALVAAAASGGTALEVSSAGLRKPVNEVYPSPTLLRMSREAGLAITLASDYHSPEGAGWGHDEVVTAARAAGYTHRAAFRCPAPVPGAPAGVRLQRAGILNQAGAQPQRPRRSRVSAIVAGLLPRRPPKRTTRSTRSGLVAGTLPSSR